MADETDLATRIAALEADLKAEKERTAAAESTLSTLQTERRQPSPGPRGSLARLSRDEAQDLADELGWSIEQVQQHYPAIEAMFRRAARPVLGGLNGLVDHIDDIDARTDLPDWKDIKDEVTKEREKHVAAGNFITRKAAAALVKARRAEDPAYLDKLADERVAKRAEQDAARVAERTAAQTEGAGNATQTSGPSPTKGASTKLDKDSYERMPSDERRKAFEDSGLAF